MIHSKGYAAQHAKAALTPFNFQRREVGPHDVLIEILYCGICHSDIHNVRDEWGGGTIFPMVPGHEIVGRVSKVGEKVKKFKVGDIAGVGCLVDSCRQCGSCQEGLEQYCEKGFTLTYNSLDKDGKTPTYGGYSNNIVVDEAFTLKIHPSMDLSKVAPLLCAGITTYSPLKYWKVGKGQKVGVIGLGGLGHMAIKFAHAMGAHVTLITTSPNKINDAKKLGADEVILSTDPEQMATHAKSLDLLLNTATGKYDLNAYLNLLKRDGTLVSIGLPNIEDSPILNIFNVLFPRRKISGSLIGGLPETQEMLDYCAKHKIYADVEVIPIQKINEAYERILKNDVKYRFVIDMQSL